MTPASLSSESEIIDLNFRRKERVGQNRILAAGGRHSFHLKKRDINQPLEKENTALLQTIMHSMNQKKDLEREQQDSG